MVTVAEAELPPRKSRNYRSEKKGLRMDLICLIVGSLILGNYVSTPVGWGCFFLGLSWCAAVAAKNRW